MKKELLRIRDRWLVATVSTVFFAAVYECFSHQVYSRAMILAFLYPLLGGLMPTTLLMLAKAKLKPGEWTRSLWDAGIASLTLGSLFGGVLEIYGTTSRLSAVLPVLGWTLLALGLLLWILELCRREKAAASYGK